MFSYVRYRDVVLMKSVGDRVGMRVSVPLGQDGLGFQIGAGRVVCAEETV